ncbi:MAG: hypothetical protein ACM3U2_16365 [Deltaproteobacteria bacterium]
MHFEPGDLLIFYGRDLSSRVIEWATRGPSHVGIVCPHALAVPPSGGHAGAARPPDGGTASALLFESTTLCDEPCALTGKCIAGVQAHEPMSRITGYPGNVALLRLMPAWRLSAREVDLLRDWLLHVASEPYDLRGALISGTRLFKWTALMPYPDLESLFCSELCAAALMRLHRLPLSNPSLYNPASLVREVRRCGTYGAPRTIKRLTGKECRA